VLFVILLFGLILCSYLGGSYCIEGMTSSTSGSTTTYTANNGATATVTNNSDGTKSLNVTKSNGTTETYTSSGTNSDTYYGPNGGTAVINTASNGASTLTITAADGTTKTVFQSSTGETYTTNTGSSKVSTTSYDNYNHYTGGSHASIYYGPDGGTVRAIDTGNGGTLVITNKNGTTEIYYINENSTSDVNVNSYYGPNGGSAKIITDSNGKTAVEVTRPDGTKIVYTEENTYSSNQTNKYYDNYNNNNNNVDTNTYYGPAGGSTTTATGPHGNTAVAYTGPGGNTVAATNYDSSAYYNSLPPGIPQNQIPPGQEDLYILKSEVVPPVCPKCPDPILKCDQNSDNTKCPPCPPCARCPEPAFDCKKVPNYNAFNQNYMPVPVLNSFSTFGM
jgi:hypothetical protein